ncbi:hypothetical protein JANAI62_14420 [Jannaschia pagri]|uniref:Uncharacterized protein n=1 Tax=Jannaschia pagri TaxID=2829797 RepID=A0ABQ4NKA1_9RHOB|nr:MULTISPECIES: DUF6732 family protein [unclassified Jannaschia]GIT90987.1 hypothetical protein JANAI61_14450 [Jannaschia sp. AI_61]GIT94819.1 hypothetical protein JANAI62_14420 [Jannaschia sp. AI_62]
MRFIPLLLLAAPAHAHPGHLGTVGAHDHWVLGIGLGVIVGAAVAGWLKGGKTDEESDEQVEEASDTPEPAA